MEPEIRQLPGPMQQVLDTLASGLAKRDGRHRGSAIIHLLENLLLDDEQMQVLALNPWDLFFLRAAAHMSGGVPGNPVPAAQYLENEVLEDEDLEDQTQAGILDLIRDGIAGDADTAGWQQSAGQAVYDGAPVNVPLLTAAVRLAVALDLVHPLTAGRIAGMLPADTAEESQDTAGESEDCGKTDRKTSVPAGDQLPRFDVVAIGAHPFLSGTIRVRIHCRHAGIHKALKRHETRVNDLLHQANTRVSPRFLYSDIIFEIEADGYTPLDMKFSVDSTAAMTLLTGNRLYSDKRVFLRELVQNAVDACNLRRIFDKSYTPRISVEFDPGFKTITFRDNGIGMDRQWIEKYFLKIGISFYRSGDMKTLHRSRGDFNFISKFGIGFLSSFMAADKVVIKTRKRNARALQITISSLREYFDVRFASRDCPGGTEVTLHLNQAHANFSRTMAHVCFLKTNLRFLSIPVELRDHEGQSTVLGHEQMAYGTDSRTGHDVVVPLAFEDSEGYLFLKAKCDRDHLFALEYARGGISIFQDGIFVTQTETLLPQGARQNIIGRINLKGRERCELSMDRNRIFWTDTQLQDLKRKVRTGIVDLANRLVDGGPAAEQSLINHLAIFFDFNEITDAMYRRLALPIRQIVAKRFRDFIRVNAAHTGGSRHVPDAGGYGEQWQQEILAGFEKRSRPPLPLN